MPHYVFQALRDLGSILPLRSTRRHVRIICSSIFDFWITSEGLGGRGRATSLRIHVRDAQRQNLVIRGERKYGISQSESWFSPQQPLHATFPSTPNPQCLGFLDTFVPPFTQTLHTGSERSTRGHAPPT